MWSKVDSVVDQWTVATRYAACLFILSFWVVLPRHTPPWPVCLGRKASSY